MARRIGKLQKTKVNSKSVESAKKQTRKRSVKYRRQLKTSLDSFTLDQGLKPFCTARQLELLTAWEAYGSKRAAAKALKINPKNFNDAKRGVERKAARQGYSPQHDLIHNLPEGFRLQGASTLYDADGNQRLQWIKSAYDTEQQQAWFEEGIRAFAEDLPRIKPIRRTRKSLDENLMTCFPVGDHHLGLLVWGEETRTEDFDLGIGENLLLSAFSYLLGLSTSKYSTLVFLGDFLHYDSMESVTPTSRNLLDTDTRYPQMVRAAIRCIRRMIESAAQTHEHVHVVIEIGNHDLSSSIFLMECLANIYENDPRITVDTHPGHYHYFDFGKCLVGIHHGHGPKGKLKDLPLIMATDQAEVWGRTDYRYIWTGHVHHDAVIDHQGCKVESFRILPPTDAWAANKGYRSMSDMKSIVLHREFGEVARHTCNPALTRSSD